MYSKMLLIRYFEDKVYDLFVKKMVPGTTHLCQGQEAVSVGVNSNLKLDDKITCTYRGHGHCIAKGLEPKNMMAEILGKSTGSCNGKGGSMHIADPSYGVLGSFAIVGAGIPVTVGAALASWYRNSGQVAVAFFGDGAANIGSFHEALNFAAIKKLPAIFVCENNLYGEYTHISKSTSVPNVADRAASYSIPGIIVDGNDLLEVFSEAKKAVARARKGDGPTLIECKTYRQKGHSRTDPGKYRPASEVQYWMERDPLDITKKYLIQNGLLTAAEDEKMKGEVGMQVEEAYQFAVNSPSPEESEVTSHVYG
jgi:pyruvate dehydrogenase E1 component alpha subunit